MPLTRLGTIDERLDRLEEKIEHVGELILRIADDIDSGFADARKTSDQEFKQLKQAITFWGGRARALDDRRRP